MKQTRASVYPLWYSYIAVATLVAITTLCYYPSLHYAFQFDDIANITKNFNIRYDTFRSLFFTGSRWISYWLNAIHYSIGKFDPFSYRVGNIIIHCLNGFLVFHVLTSALARVRHASFFKTNSLLIGVISCALFLLHPVQTQTVSYVIQGELEGMAALFSLSCITLFLRATQTNAARQSVLYTLLMFIIALFSCGTKEITIVLPLLLLLIDWFFVAQGSWTEIKKRGWMHSIIFCSILSMYLYLLNPRFFYDLLGLKMAVQNNIGNVITHVPNQQITPIMFLLSQFKVILHYITIFLWPFNISVEYDWILTKGFFAPDCLLPLATLVAIGWLLIHLLKMNPINPVCFGMIWFFICILPRSSIVPSPELIVDYKTYLGSIGWLFIIASGIAYGLTSAASYLKTLNKYAPIISSACVLLIATGLGYATYERNKVWSSGLAFWGNIIENAPGKARAYNNYGVELSQGCNRYADAIPYFQRAISMDAQYPDPCNNLAVAYARTDNIPGAIAAVKQGLQINKHYPEGYNNLASFYLQLNDLDNAQLCLNKALELRAHYGKAHFNLGRVYSLRGDNQKAWECYKKACLHGDFDTEIGFTVYAQASLALQKYDDAIIGYKKVLELAPQNVAALFNIANALYLKGEYQDALSWYNKTLMLAPHDDKVLFNVGETYIKLGQIDQAITYYERIKPGAIIHTTQRLTECYKAVGKPDKALEVASRLQKQQIGQL